MQDVCDMGMISDASMNIVAKSSEPQPPPRSPPTNLFRKLILKLEPVSRGSCVSTHCTQTQF